VTKARKKTPVRSAKSKAANRLAAPARAAYRVDPTEGDNIDGDDLVIRRAAVAALGNVIGSVVVADAETGRVYTIVNQKLAFRSGFTPCSTIKLVTSLAALNEHIIERNTYIYLGRYSSYNLTNALAKSNNPYFSILGARLGFDKVAYYARMMGLGEKAGLDIAGEQPGTLPVIPPASGVGIMCAYGEGVKLTPLQLTAMLGAIANGGTLYYLQYPKTQGEQNNFTPQVKRQLDMKRAIEDVQVGMRGAVDFGTATRARYDAAEAVLGKTGTCTDYDTANHMGWFGSYAEMGKKKLVVVVMLVGGSSINGPLASGVAGSLYKQLADQRYSVQGRPKSNLPEIIYTTPTCCSQ
jgi:cell division protein FtsI/penicillin-binding protein 2